MILSDAKIRAEMERGRIVIRPFREDCLGTNSYDVHLGPFLSVYRGGALDARRPNPSGSSASPPLATSSSPASSTSE